MTATPPQASANIKSKAILDQVAPRVRAHYDSPLVEYLKSQDFYMNQGNVDVHLAQSFGFCNGVRRAIDIAYAAHAAYPDNTIWLIGEIIHNPEVNARLDEMGLKRLPWRTKSPDYNQIQAGDVVLIPAFGVTVAMRQDFIERGVHLVDSTCGHVMKVWNKVSQYAKAGVTSIIHGKTKHEESMAIASHSRGRDGDGKFLILADKEDALFLADVLVGKCSHQDFLSRFKGSYSVGFDPAADLLSLGMANQTTMLQGETAYIQQVLREALILRDGDDARFQVCDTICGATQSRQNSLFELLDSQLDALFIVGGYNSSNTTQLAKIASPRVPTYFISSADCLEDLTQVRAFDIHAKEERLVNLDPRAADLNRRWRIGITAGASCPANLIEQTIRRLLLLRGEGEPQLSCE